MPPLTLRKTERVAAGTRAGRAAGVYYWSDSLLTFPTWYEYETILDNAL